MDTQFESHPLQAKALRELLFKPHAKFSELNVEKIPTDHFSFHLKALLQADLITKSTNGCYSLTPKGKEFANRFDTHAVKVEKQAKLGVLFVVTRDSANQKDYLMYQRRKHPFYGFIGFHSGKIKYGESIFDTAIRECLEETNLTGEPKLVGIRHTRVFNPDNQLLEDKYFFVCNIHNPTGELREQQEEGLNTWVTKDQLLNTPNRFKDVESTLIWLDSPELTFEELTDITSHF